MNYQTVVSFDPNLRDAWFTDTDTLPTAMQGLVYAGIYIVTGAPVATVGKYLPGAIVHNAVDGTDWQMNGSTASPSFVLLESSASGFTLPLSETDAATTTGTSFALIMSALTTGVAQKITAAAATTGALFEAIATAATLTTGRYFKANDGATDVWGIGANGHIHTNQTTAPTVGSVTAQGITAAAVTAGSGDVAGQVTTTGTQNNVSASVIPIAFNKTYTVAPKSVVLMPLNASAANGTSLAYVSAISATGFSISVTPSATAGATPSWAFQVIA